MAKPGNIDVIFACDVAGMQIPLGFNLKDYIEGFDCFIFPGA